MSRRDRAQQYWQAYEASLRPPPGSAARNLERLRRRIRAGEVVDDAPLDRPARPRRAAAGLVLLGKSAAATLGIATATLLSIKLIAAGWAPTSAPADTSADASAAASAGTPEGASASAPTEAVEPGGPAPARPIPHDRASAPQLAAEGTASAMPAARSLPPAEPRRASPPRDSGPAADLLRAEVQLMDRARAALERDDARALWQLMDEHARRFPAGALTEEREAWRAVAACRLGHPDAASSAARFLRAHAGSAQAAKVRRACDGLPSDRMTDGTPSAG